MSRQPIPASVVRTAPLSVQVCVPSKWTDEQVVEWVESEYPCGTEHGWQIRTDGDDPERVPCKQMPDNVHIVLIA